MEYFEIEGGYTLKGEVVPQGAKNEALQVIAASLLTEEPVHLKNIPDILDIRRQFKILEKLGVTVRKHDANSYTIQAENIDLNYMHSEEALTFIQKIRGSVMLLGPLLARYGKAFLPKPGGDKIGRRRLDTHFLGLEKLGAKISYKQKEQSFYLESDGRLQGNYILLDEPSVTGTANVIMAAVLAQGNTTIYNAASEPYIQQLCKMLNRMGAKIQGIGSNLLRIEGVEKLSGTEHTLLPDMIEVGSFIGVASATQSDIIIKNAGVKYLGNILPTMRKFGVNFEIRDDDIHVLPTEVNKIQTYRDGSILSVYDAPWPGFPPDLISIMLVIAAQAEGNVLIQQKMFESRLFFVDKLIDMGARIILCDPHRVVVMGLGRQYPLRGISMTSPDIRAGIALLIAALSAEGTSKIYNIEQIDRGYQNIEKRLQKLGAKIVRKSE